MIEKKVKELMVKLTDYAVIDENDTLLDAVIELEKAQAKLPPDRMKHRAVLVRNKSGKIVGKLGHLAFLRGLEPKYNSVGDIKALARAGLSPEFVNSMMDTYRFWESSLNDICRRAKNLKVRDIMHPVTENIDEDASITEAIHKFVMWQTLSILVTRKDDIVGVLRLGDLYSEVTQLMKAECDCEE